MDNPADKKILPFRPAPGTRPSPLSQEIDQEEQSRRYGRLQTSRMRAIQQASRAGEPKPQEERMSFFVFFCSLILALIGDIAEFVTAGTVGWFVGLFVDVILLMIFGFSKKKRDQARKIFIALGIEKIPVISFLPIRTLMLLWVYFSSRSKVAQTLQAGARELESGTIKKAA